MTEISLANALGGLLAIPQFFVYRLVWNSLKNKFEKTPCYVNGTALGKDEGGNRATWVDYPTAIAGLQALRARDGQNAWTLGWWVTKEAGYWFLDADNAIKDTGELTQEAAYLFQALPGAFCEQSSGGKGFHWIGRGLVPPHSSRPAVAQAVGLEFYTDGRGIAFGLNDKATGNADVDHTAAISIIAGHWFKPNDLANHAVSGVDPSYRGPYDDQELLRRALNSQNVKGVLNGQATFADLWNRLDRSRRCAHRTPHADVGPQARQVGQGRTCQLLGKHDSQGLRGVLQGLRAGRTRCADARGDH
jgi:primase-polymerase (primpol)-like protein